MKRVLAILAVAFIASSGWGENLTSPDFKGWLSSARPLAKGDAVVVEIDASTKLSFSASSSDSKLFTLDFSGGQAGSLFSFLPRGKTGAERSVDGKQDYSLSGRLVAQVTDIDASGRAQLAGSRSVSIAGKLESVTVSGWLYPARVPSDGRVPFSMLGDSRLSYQTMISTGSDVLSPADITDVLSTLAPPAAAPAAAGQPAGVTGQAAATTQPTAAATTLTLTDAKKRELLLLYINRLVDIVFSGE